MPENGFNEGFINPSIITANSTRPGLMNNQVTPPAGSIVGRPGDPSPSPLNFLGKLGNILNPFSSLISGGLSAVANYFGQKQQIKAEKEMAREQRDWNEKMFERQNEINDANWQRETEYNSPVNQVNRLMDAGLNPLAVGLDGNSGAGMVNAPQALGYDRASLGNMQNPISSGFKAFTEMQGLNNQRKLINAQVDKLQEEQSSLKLDNEFKDKTMEARVQAEELANNLTKEQIEKAKQEIKESEQRIKESIARTDNEIEKKGLILAEKVLREAETKEVLELIPYKKNLMAAQTMAQKAAASASFMHALYEQKLIDSGYIDKLVEDLDASIREKEARGASQEVMNALNSWKQSVKDGTFFDLDSLPKWRIRDRIAMWIANKLISFTSAASEAVGGGLSGILK